MAEGFGYGGFSGIAYPYWLSPQPSYYPASAYMASPPVPSYDPAQGGFDPMFAHASYHPSTTDWSFNPSYHDNSRSQTPSSAFYADNSRLGRGEYAYRDMLSGFYSARGEPSSDFVPLPTEESSERQHLNSVPINSTTSSASVVPSVADIMSYRPIEPSSDVYPYRNTLDEERPRHYHPCYGNLESMNVVPAPPVEPYTYATLSIPTPLMPSVKTESIFSQTGIQLGEGRSLPSNSDVRSSHALENLPGGQSSVHGSSVEPVNFDVLLGYGEATGHVKPLSENPDLPIGIVDSSGLRSPQPPLPLQFDFKLPSSVFKDNVEFNGVSSIFKMPYTLVSGGEIGVSESSLKDAIEDLNRHEHRSCNQVKVTSEGPSAPTMFSMGSESCDAKKAGNGNAQSAVKYEAVLEGNANQPGGDVEVNQKPCKLQSLDIVDKDKKIMGFEGSSSRSNADDVSTGLSPERHLCGEGDFQSLTSVPKVSSAVNAMHDLSEVLVYECFNNESLLKLEQLEMLDKVVKNLTKCLKKITANKTISGESSIPAHVPCPNEVNLDEAPKGVAKDFQESNVKKVDDICFKRHVEKNEMNQSIKNILASNFPDGEENNQQTLLYKNLWLETEAALCSTTCMARYRQMENTIGKHCLTEISSDALTESQIKHGVSSENDVVKKCHDEPESSKFNSDHVDAELSHMSRSCIGGLEQTIHGNFKYYFPTLGKILDAIPQESPEPTTDSKDVLDTQILKNQEMNCQTKSQNCPDKDIDVIDRFQILKQQQGTKFKFKSQNCPETKLSDFENNPEALGKSSCVSNVIDRFPILKRWDLNLGEQPINNMEIDSDSDSDSEDEQQPRSNTPTRLASMMMRALEMNSESEACIDTEASASGDGDGYESPTSDWEHVLKED